MAKLLSWIRGRPPRGRYTLLRRLLQLGMLGAFATQVLLHGAIVKGSLASSRLFGTIPLLDIFAWLEHVVASHSATLESLIAMLVVFGIYSVLGRFFCGWICPMDMLFSIFERKLITPRGPRRSQPHLPTRLERIAPPVFMALFLVLSFVLAQPFFTTLSPIAGTTKLASTLVGILVKVPGATVGLALAWGVIVAAALAINVVGEYVFGVKRLWCRYVCPVGNIFGHVMNKYSLLTVKPVRSEDCIKCRLCSMACPMTIDVMSYAVEGKQVRDPRCFRCGRCVEVCPRNVLSLTFSPPSRQASRESSR